MEGEGTLLERRGVLPSKRPMLSAQFTENPYLVTGMIKWGEGRGQLAHIGSLGIG
jgi:hypothetical protein